MTKRELGTKRRCNSCNTKFFDLNTDPIVCPKCGTVFLTATQPVRAQRVVAQEEEREAETGPETISLEEAEAVAEKETPSGDEDIEIEDDEAPDETFLEEEEEDSDDVSGLIDGDIENDEEG